MDPLLTLTTTMYHPKRIIVTKPIRLDENLTIFTVCLDVPKRNYVKLGLLVSTRLMLDMVFEGHSYYSYSYIPVVTSLYKQNLAPCFRHRRIIISCSSG